MCVTLASNPYHPGGILRRTENDRLHELMQRLVLENAVPVRSHEPRSGRSGTLAPFMLASGSAEEVFDRLYPPLTDTWHGLEKQRLLLRESFAQRATELFNITHRRIGLAALGADLRMSLPGNPGIVTVNGFLSDELSDFSGYLEGEPNRASRDKVDLVAERAEVCRWLHSQEQRLRDLGLFTESVQLELAWTLHRAFGTLAPDHCFGLTGQGALRFGDIEAWASRHDEIFLVSGPPLMPGTRPPRVTHHGAGIDLILPDGWFFPFMYSSDTLFIDMFPSSLHRDPDFEYARDHLEPTWEKFWWRLSNTMEGSLFKAVCRAWTCDIQDIVSPLAQRQWKDEAYLDDESLGPVFGYRLNRP